MSNSFSSPTFSFLGNQVDPQNVQAILEELHRSPPSILMHIECYHYEVRHYREKDANGTEVEKVRTEKVITRSASDNVRIMSYADVSDPLYLDLTGLDYKVKFFKLKLKPSLRFADDGSEVEYNRQVADFKYRNNWDTHYHYSEEKKILGFREYMFIPVESSSKTTSYIGRSWYVLFTFLSVTELYKNYINELSKYHEYTISKEISTLSINLFQQVKPLPEFRIVTPEYDNRYPPYNRDF